MRLSIAVLGFFVASVVAVPAMARDFRVQQLPNGSAFSCDTCHDMGNVGYVNPFGVQVLEALSGGDVVWSELAQRDADRDGYTNGEELGDPDGTWRPGQPNPGGTATHPGYYNSNPCGNGVLEASEECENDDPGDFTCQDAGFYAGRVICNSVCQIDTSFCINCGNGVVDDNEECEGTDLRGRSCTDLGYDGGSLGCLANCALDVSACQGSPTPVCGDGVVVAGEDCEGDNLGGNSCVTIGFADGGILECNSDCTFDTDYCLGRPADAEEPQPVPEDDTGAPPLPPGAFANDDDDGGGCSTATSGAPAGLIVLLLALVRLRRRW